MKTTIKTYYETPKVKYSLLNAVIQKEVFTLSKFFSICILLILGFLFVQHFINFNLNYFDIGLGIYGGVGIWKTTFISITISLIQFIVQYMTTLLGIGILYYTLSIQSINKKIVS